MRVELGAPIVLVAGVDALWHLPAARKASSRGAPWATIESRWRSGHVPERWPTLCGLHGDVYVYNGPLRRRRACAVCRQRNAGADVVDPLAA